METVEERLARRLVFRHGLAPRIDIEKLAKLYADVTSLPFPVEVDGVSRFLKCPGRRPEILINSSQPPRRWRFTLAHELGHVLIPGHTGSIVDDTDLASGEEKSRYREKEGEANRFAAELLMPSDWARDEIGMPKDMAARVNRLAERADVSIDAAVLKVICVGPPGYIVAKAVNDRVEWAAKTSGTRSNRPNVGARLAPGLVDPRRNYTVLNASSGAYHWWKEEIEVAVPEAPTQPWREILDEIVSDLDLEDARKAKQSINGIIAVANGFLRDGRSRESIYAACLHNIRNRAGDSPDVKRIMKHRKFSDFLLARVYEFEI